MELKNRFSRGVLRIALYPGLDPRFLLALLDNDFLEGIVIETLGVGNVPTEGRWSLVPLILRMTKAGIPVLLASQFPIRTGMAKEYKPAEAPIAAGALAALDMSSPAAVTKFMWVLPQVQEKIDSGTLPEQRKLQEIERMMTTNYVGEIT
jgi:L-asparaginase/Glu-tRNA(Gln) amidotransferase subunit D